MVNIDELHKITFAIAAKSGAAFPSPDEWNNFANYANVDLYNYYNDIRKAALLKNKEGHTINMPSSLKVFVTNEAAIAFTSGVGNIPTDQSSNLQLSAGGKSVKKVDYNRREAYLNSTIDTPTVATPIYCELNSTMLIYPITITAGLLTYLRTPVTVKWAYTLTSNRPVYDLANSVNSEFQAEEKLKLAARILAYMGIQVRDGQLEQYANNEIKQAS
ncbi:MAG: hypothetical protein JWQ09_5883 [Segetibacter sp.]|nr:hypothetical protein [Segetibacter sp.]